MSSVNRQFIALTILSCLAGSLLTLKFSQRDRQAIIDDFHRLSYGDGSTWPRNTWFGVKTTQNPNDVWIHQEIISEQKPDLIIECGTAAGGSALIWALILREVNSEGRVLTIDIRDSAQKAREFALWSERIDFLVGSSTDPQIFEEVRRRALGKRVLVILDSDHSRDHVLKELNLYSQLVQPGGYLIAHDTNVNGHPAYEAHGPGPMEALQAFLPQHPAFEADRGRERLLFTMHPSGYLKRVR